MLNGTLLPCGWLQVWLPPWALPWSGPPSPEHCCTHNQPVVTWKWWHTMPSHMTSNVQSHDIQILWCRPHTYNLTDIFSPSLSLPPSSSSSLSLSLSLSLPHPPVSFTQSTGHKCDMFIFFTSITLTRSGWLWAVTTSSPLTTWPFGWGSWSCDVVWECLNTLACCCDAE